MTDEFRSTYPLGLSYASYTLILALPLLLLQWFAIGHWLDVLYRRGRGRRALRPCQTTTGINVATMHPRTDTCSPAKKRASISSVLGTSPRRRAVHQPGSHFLPG